MLVWNVLQNSPAWLLQHAIIWTFNMLSGGANQPFSAVSVHLRDVLLCCLFQVSFRVCCVVLLFLWHEMWMWQVGEEIYSRPKKKKHRHTHTRLRGDNKQIAIILLFISSLIEVCLVIYFSLSVVFNELNNARRLPHYLALFPFQAAHVLCVFVHVCLSSIECVYVYLCLCVCTYILIPLVGRRGCVHYRPVPALSL